MAKIKNIAILILAGLFLLCCGCGQPQRRSSIEETSLFDGQKLILNLENKGYPGSTSFELREPLKTETLEECLDDTGTVTKTESGWQLSLDNGDGTKNLFYIHDAGERQYDLLDLKVYLQGKSDSADLAPAVYVLLFPMCGVVESGASEVDYIGLTSSELTVDTDYEIKASIEDIMNFYKESGWYDAVREENTILIKGYLKPPTREAYSGYWSDESVLPIRLVFTVEDGKTFFSISCYEGSSS